MTNNDDRAERVRLRSGAAECTGHSGQGTSLPPSLMSGMQCYKTKICRFFVESRCQRGSDCTFAHSLEELRAKPDLRKRHILRLRPRECGVASARSVYKTSLCFMWQKGRCSYEADECRYAHGIHELRTLPLKLNGQGGATGAAAECIDTPECQPYTLVDQPEWLASGDDTTPISSTAESTPAAALANGQSHTPSVSSVVDDGRWVPPPPTLLPPPPTIPPPPPPAPSCPPAQGDYGDYWQGAYETNQQQTMDTWYRYASGVGQYGGSVPSYPTQLDTQYSSFPCYPISGGFGTHCAWHGNGCEMGSCPSYSYDETMQAQNHHHHNQHQAGYTGYVEDGQWSE
mmetsp:Transcript_21863/g.62219  ORF Transcript_21863/g.62219 Transcript_21863/m.62219 type:complete len:343 (+) Transcript_21863:98-1126(+)